MIKCNKTQPEEQKRLNLTMEKNNLNKEIVIPVGHNTPRDTQGLSYKKLIKTGDKQLWQESLCCEIGRLAQGWKESCGLNAMFLIKKKIKCLKIRK